MAVEENRPLPRLGEVLLIKGLVTPQALHQALLMQLEEHGKLGTILQRLGLVTQEAIDRCYVEEIITPVIARELDALTDGAYRGLNGVQITFRRLVRQNLVTEDLLHASAEVGRLVTIKGEAVVSQEGHSSLPFEFTIDPRTSTVTIDQLFRGGLRLWLRRMMNLGTGDHGKDEHIPSP